MWVNKKKDDDEDEDKLGDWEIGRLGDREIGSLGDWEIGGLATTIVTKAIFLSSETILFRADVRPCWLGWSAKHDQLFNSTPRTPSVFVFAMASLVVLQAPFSE